MFAQAHLKQMGGSADSVLRSSCAYWLEATRGHQPNPFIGRRP